LNISKIISKIYNWDYELAFANIQVSMILLLGNNSVISGAGIPFGIGLMEGTEMKAAQTFVPFGDISVGVMIVWQQFIIKLTS